DRPCFHPPRQAEQRALVRQVGKAEPAIAIGIDADLLGVMKGFDHGAFPSGGSLVHPKLPRGTCPNKRPRADPGTPIFQPGPQTEALSLDRSLRFSSSATSS